MFSGLNFSEYSYMKFVSEYSYMISLYSSFFASAGWRWWWWKQWFPKRCLSLFPIIMKMQLVII